MTGFARRVAVAAALPASAVAVAVVAARFQEHLHLVLQGLRLVLQGSPVDGVWQGNAMMDTSNEACSSFGCF